MPNITLLGMTLPISRKAIPWISALVVIAIAAIVYRQTIATPVDIVSAREMNARLEREVEEYGLHAMEQPTKHELLEDADGALGVRVYADHCVLIQRKTVRGIRTEVRTRLVLDLARAGLRAENRIDRPMLPSLWAMATTGRWPTPLYAQGRGCNGGCLNPHPNPFKWWYGARRGEWIEIWRQWPEGCQHVQMLHPASGNWETNADGSPRVRWTCCVH